MAGNNSNILLLASLGLIAVYVLNKPEPVPIEEPGRTEEEQVAINDAQERGETGRIANSESVPSEQQWHAWFKDINWWKYIPTYVHQKWLNMLAMDGVYKDMLTESEFLKAIKDHNLISEYDYARAIYLRGDPTPPELIEPDYTGLSPQDAEAKRRQFELDKVIYTVQHPSNFYDGPTSPLVPGILRAIPGSPHSGPFVPGAIVLTSPYAAIEQVGEVIRDRLGPILGRLGDLFGHKGNGLL